MTASLLRWQADKPYNELPHLPPEPELETRAVLKRCIEARAALAELKQAADLIPNQRMLINTIPLLEAKDSSEIESIVTTTDLLFQHAQDGDNHADPATKEALRYRKALHHGYRSPRGLDKALILQLSSGQWLRDGLNLIIGGPTGVGKTWLACALAHQACREGYSVRYLRLPRLLEELGLAHGDGRFAKLMSSYAKTDLLILDDWGLAPFTAEQRRDMLELLDDRYGQRSTLVTSQMPVDNWHELIGDPTLADAILDRLVHNAYRINLKGESMRKRAKKLTTPGTSE